MDEIDRENLSLAINRIGAIAGILFLLNAPLSIYLREAPQAAVVGVPDPISLFGIPVTLKEVGLAVVVSLFIQWSIVRNLIFVKTKVYGSNFVLSDNKRMIVERAALLNPFFCIRGKVGAVFSLLTLAGFIVAAFLIDAQLVLLLFSLRFSGDIIDFLLPVLITATWLPIPIIAAWNIYRVDQKLFGQRHAIFRSFTFILTFGLLVIGLDFS